MPPAAVGVPFVPSITMCPKTLKLVLEMKVTNGEGLEASLAIRMMLLFGSWQSSSALVGSVPAPLSAVEIGPAIKLPGGELVKSSTHTRLFPSPTQTWWPLATSTPSGPAQSLRVIVTGHSTLPAKPGAGAVNGVSSELLLVLTTWIALLVRSARR